MPIIVYKTMTIQVVWTQIRRIVCDGCAQPFNYLTAGDRTEQTTGLPVISSEEGMRATVAKQVQAALDKVAVKPRQGAAMCPHCQRYQGWMVSRSRFRTYGKAIGIGVLVGAVAALVAYCMDQSMLVVQASGAAVPFLACLIASRWALSPGPHEGKTDGRAMKDQELVDFYAVCKEKDLDPSLAWFAGIGGKFHEKVPVIPLPNYDGTAKG